MINFLEELKNFKPSRDTGDLEQYLSEMDITDMNDIVKDVMEKAASGEKNY